MRHKQRRDALLKRLERDCVVILTTNPEQPRNGDVLYPFRADSDFWYFTGLTEPNAIAVFSEQNYTIFLRDKDPAREIWDGKRLGVKDAPRVLLSDQAFCIENLADELPKLIPQTATIYYDAKPFARNKLDEMLTPLLTSRNCQTLNAHSSEMRLIKDADEIALMQQASDISITAHTMAMAQVKNGLFEYEIASIFDGFFKKNNAQHAYSPIVAGGKNSCVLHYIENNETLKSGDLLLIDAGCEVAGYAADITRTFPINGKFSPAQQQIYQIVLSAQLAAIASIAPNISVKKPHEIASDVIRNGLIKLGILTLNGDLAQFYMHGTGHWLGLDVHDVGAYKLNHQNRHFVAGMVMTVEPGIYIRPHPAINPIYWNIGIRIEDDILVTESGNRVLTQNLVKEIADIEFLMGKK